jgi:predicted patatin/cPLA2 family phospholipase
MKEHDKTKRARRTNPPSRSLVLATAFLLALTSACASVPKRTPLPENLVAEASVPGGERARQWGDVKPTFSDEWFAMSKEETRASFGAAMGSQHNYLAISGGGANGAFGAGLLCGWTEAGTRPEFTLVSGVSTGALIAPFAFLGPEYDHVLRTFYTSTSTGDIVKKRSIFNILTSDAATSSKPLQELIAEVFTQEVMEAVAAEFRKGRGLNIGTTNLDANRPVHWNIGAIAASGDPGALELIRKILLASASIPAVFPPVLIDVEVDGRRYDELHVDGGATAQVYIYPAGVDWERVLEKLEVTEMPNLYIIRNSILDPRYTEVENKIFTIVGRALSSMIRTQGIGNMYEIYLMAIRDGLDYHLAYIPGSFKDEPEEAFDPVYMKKLFDLAFERAKGGYPWDNVPPGYDREAAEPE